MIFDRSWIDPSIHLGFYRSIFGLVAWFDIRLSLNLTTLLGFPLSRRNIPAQFNIFSEQKILSSSEFSAQVHFLSRPEQLSEH